MGELPSGTQQKLFWHLGIIFGLNDSTADKILNLILKYEFLQGLENVSHYKSALAYKVLQFYDFSTEPVDNFVDIRLKMAYKHDKS